ncbi:unnamed protein product, partial [Ectocarpus sp. 13 AM-2016]
MLPTSRTKRGLPRHYPVSGCRTQFSCSCDTLPCGPYAKGAGRKFKQRLQQCAWQHVDGKKKETTSSKNQDLKIMAHLDYAHSRFYSCTTSCLNTTRTHRNYITNTLPRAICTTCMGKVRGGCTQNSSLLKVMPPRLSLL